MYLYVGLAFFFVWTLILLFPIRIVLNYRLQQGEDLLLVEVYWLGMRLVRRFIPGLSVDSSSEEARLEEAELQEAEGGVKGAVDDGEDAPSVLSEIDAIINAVARCYHLVFDTAHIILHGEHPPNSRHHPLYHWALRHFSQDAAHLIRQLEELKWSTTIGLGDAAATAIIAGALLGLKAAGFAWLQRKVEVDPARLDWQVLPHYGGLWIEVCIHCILRVNAGHIIITGIANSFRSLFQRAAWRRKQLAAVEE